MTIGAQTRACTKCRLNTEPATTKGRSMSVQEGPDFKRYAANGTSLTFAIPFLLLSASDLVVTLDGYVLTTGFVLANVGGVNASATFSTAPIGDLLFQSKISFQRLVDYQDNGDLLSPTLNRDFDRLWLALKGIRRDSGRAITVSLLEPEGVPPLPPASARINQMMGFDSVGNPVVVAPASGSANELGILLQDTIDPFNGDYKIGVRQATPNAVGISQHAVNLQTVSLQMYGAKDDWNGTTGTNCATAIANIVADFPNGCRIRAPRTVGGSGIYYINGSAGSADMSKYVLDTDPDVSFWHVGTNTHLIGPGLRTTRSVSIYRATLGYTYYLSATPYGDVAGKPYVLSAADGEAPIVERIITSATNTMQFKAVSFSTGALTDAAASTDGNFANFGNISGTGFTVGSVAIRPGQEVHAQITLPSNFGKVCAYVETEGGWVIFAQDAITGGVITRYVFLEGFAIQSTNIGSPFSDAPAYNLAVATLGIKVHGVRSFSVLLNHVEVARMDEQNLTSDILRAGWGAGQVSNTNPAYISHPSRIRNNRTYGMRPLKVVIAGDSTSDKVNPFSMVNHMRRTASGVGGIQFKLIRNQAIAGQTALQQRDIINATDYQALGGFDYMLVDVGINDIGGGSTATDFITAIVDIINRCATFNIIPLIGIPAMFYDQASAAPYGQTGQGTANADRGAPYRLPLLRKLAELNVQAVILPIQDMGAILPSSLANPDLNPVVQDNVHQSNWGGELKGMAWAKALIGYMYARVRKDIAYRTIKASWIPAAIQATYGNLVKPAFGINGDTFYMGNALNMPAGVSSTPGPEVPPFGTKVIQLPATYGPPNQRFIWLPAGVTNGNWTLQVLMRFDQDGAIYTQRSTPTAVYVDFSSVSWPLPN